MRSPIAVEQRGKSRILRQAGAEEERRRDALRPGAPPQRRTLLRHVPEAEFRRQRGGFRERNAATKPSPLRRSKEPSPRGEGRVRGRCRELALTPTLSRT